MKDLSAKADLAWLGALIADVRAAAPKATFLLAGATARDVLMKHSHGIDTGRATEDVDLAFAMESWKEFGNLREALLRSGRFIADGKGPQRVRHTGAGHSRVDLIPFSGVENRDRQIAWPPDGSHVMSVIGFQEASRAAEAVMLRGAHQVSVVSLPALALLKLSAWKARRLVEQGKDAQDIRVLLHHYLDAGNQDRLYSEAGHLLEHEDFDYERAGAWLLGLDAKRIISARGAPGQAHEFFQSLIQDEVDAGEESTLLGDMKSLDPTVDLALIRSFFEGFSYVEARRPAGRDPVNQGC